MALRDARKKPMHVAHVHHHGHDRRPPLVLDQAETPSSIRWFATGKDGPGIAVEACRRPCRRSRRSEDGGGGSSVPSGDESISGTRSYCSRYLYSVAYESALSTIRPQAYSRAYFFNKYVQEELTKGILASASILLAAAPLLATGSTLVSSLVVPCEPVLSTCKVQSDLTKVDATEARAGPRHETDSTTKTTNVCVRQYISKIRRTLVSPPRWSRASAGTYPEGHEKACARTDERNRTPTRTSGTHLVYLSCPPHLIVGVAVMAFAGLGPPPAPAPSRVVDLQSWPTTRPNHLQIVSHLARPPASSVGLSHHPPRPPEKNVWSCPPPAPTARKIRLRLVLPAIRPNHLHMSISLRYLARPPATLSSAGLARHPPQLPANLVLPATRPNRLLKSVVNLARPPATFSSVGLGHHPPQPPANISSLTRPPAVFSWSWPPPSPTTGECLAGGVDESACGADTTVATTTNAPLAWPSVLSTPAG
ncbi:hypothetical protein BKA93DRAFT_748877 [Sparassis latifolia]